MSVPNKTWKVNNTRIGPSGKGVMHEGSNEYLIKRGSTSHREGKGPSGKKARPYRRIIKALAEFASNQPRLIWCSDDRSPRLAFRSRKRI